MKRFRSAEEAIDAWIDGETTPGETFEIERNISTSMEWKRASEAAKRLRSGIAGVFDELRAETPPWTERSAPVPAAALRPRLQGVIVAVAAAAAVIAVVWFAPGGSVEAGTPLEIIERAADRISRQNDVLLFGRVEFPGPKALLDAFAGGKETAGASGGNFRLLVDRENRWLLQFGSDPGSDWSKSKPVSGFDGSEFWNFDPSTGVLETSTEAPITGAQGLDLEAGDDWRSKRWLDYLSWGFLERLPREDSGGTFREATWPADRRAGRRVFELVPPKSGEERSIVVSRTMVTVDPARDQVERVVIETSMAGFSLVRLTVEVAAENGFPSAAIFGPEAHGAERRR